MTHIQTARLVPLMLLAATASALPACESAPAQPRPVASASGQSGARPQPAVPPDSPIALSQVRERALALIEQLSRSQSPQVRANAVEAAAEAPNRLESVVIKGLTDASPGVRAVAATAVGTARLASAVDRVPPLLGDAQPEVKASAIFALARNNQDVDRSPLASMLLEDSSPWVRRHAAFLLGELGDPSAIPLLRTAAIDPFPQATREQAKNLQLQVTEALARLGDVKARQSLRAALYPSRPEELETVVLAVQIIQRLQDREAIDQLVYLARYKDPAGNKYPAEVRLAIAGALAAMGVAEHAGTADEFLASPNPALRSQAAYVLGQVGGRSSWGKLAALLDDPDEGVRVSAAAAVLRSSAKP